MSKVITEFDTILEELYNEFLTLDVPQRYWSLKIGQYKTYLKLRKRDNAFKRALMYHLIELIKEVKTKKRTKVWVANKKASFMSQAQPVLLENLLRSNLDLSTQDFIQLYTSFKEVAEQNLMPITFWPITRLATRLEKQTEANGVDIELKAFLQAMLDWKVMEFEWYYTSSDVNKTRKKIENILLNTIHEGKTTVFKLFEDDLGILVNQSIAELPNQQKDDWYQLFRIFSKSTASKPTKDFYKKVKTIIDRIGQEFYKNKLDQWITFLINHKEKRVEQNDSAFQGEAYVYSDIEFLENSNKVFMKGAIWTLLSFQDQTTIQNIAKLAEVCFKKIPGVGARAAGVGNACVYLLANVEGLEGVSQLSRLKMRVTQLNTKKLIEKSINEAAKKRGISMLEIEELAVPHFDLVNGQKEYNFEDFKLKIEVESFKKVIQYWIKPDGKRQKSTPALVKNSPELKKDLKQAKNEIKQIKATLSNQRERMENLFIVERKLTFEQFNKYYHHHGLVSLISHKLLWEFEIDGTYKALYFDGVYWKTREGAQINDLEKAKNIRLWHPINSNTDEIEAWRNLFNELQIRQPLKQVYREIYILTDAEVNTSVYSNRMAAHILKQHQLNALAKLRGWRYTLMGAFDHGGYGAIKYLPHYGLRAEFWMEEVVDDNAISGAGMWLYVSTDQVRFLDESNEVVELSNIPKLIFSEVMRDVDMFVGVTSVGNDPQWQDNGGLRRFNNYWNKYSFGDLSEIAKTRKTILENLVPRLKIRDIAAVDGKFLRVKGKLRDYKIHIGSTNILMEPNDQYLCIVPDRGGDKRMEKVFLPFEGDNGLSIILSKAFLLAADDKITDLTIISQLKR